MFKYELEQLVRVQYMNQVIMGTVYERTHIENSTGTVNRYKVQPLNSELGALEPWETSLDSLN